MTSRSLTVYVVLVALVAGSSQPVAARTSALTGAALGWSLGALELGPWEAYLARELTPDLDLIQPIDVPEITWLQIDHDIVLPEFARPLVGSARPPRLSLFTAETTKALQIGTLFDDPDRSAGPGLERSVVLSGISSRLSEHQRLSVSAVLASQQFSHSMLDLTEFDGEFRPVDFFAADRDVSTGAGLQLGFASELAPRLLLKTSFQSRVNMDELLSVRGVHGQSADLDLPPRLRMGLDLQASDRTLFTAAVSQVFYSDVGAFPSRSLPARFNALLGDSGSPELRWDDLTVLSFGMRWRHESDLEFNVDFHTRSQPSPSATSLSAALGNELAQHSVLMGVGKRIGERARIDVSASYAPSEFAFGGNVLGVVSNRLDQAVEVAARLNVRF